MAGLFCASPYKVVSSIVKGSVYLQYNIIDRIVHLCACRLKERRILRNVYISIYKNMHF